MAATSILVLVLSVLGVSLGRDIRESPIVGIVDGQTLDIKQAPYMAALFEDVAWPVKRLLCGGTIVHPNFILTAAQCLSEKNLKKLIIIAGSNTLSSGEFRQPRDLDKVFIHERFNETNMDYDIALIKLLYPLTLGPNVGLSLLADETVLTPPNTIGYVTGWGSVKKTVNSPPSEFLRQLEMTVRRPIDCEEHFDTFSEENEICLWKKDSGPCIGDAGGPFTASNGLQIGIISRGNTCGHMPTTVVKVAPHLAWIDITISNNI